MSDETTNALLKELISEIKSLKQDKPKEEKNEKETTKEEETVLEAGPTPPIETPVPSEYREVVETVLNKEFGVRVVPLSDKPAFQLEITVPPKYSNATKDHIEMYGGDLRSRVIDYAAGSNGVREWCEAIYKNLGPEKQAQITAARVEDLR